jgi:putative ABC transport system ATP-binding protein
VEVAGSDGGRGPADNTGTETAPPAEPIVEAHELYRFYHAGDDETFALRGVSLSARRGEIVAVVGPSGSGKSTLLNCLAGLDEPDGGHVVVAGERLTRRPEVLKASLRARCVGVLLQSGNLLEHLSIVGNVRAAQALVAGGARRNADELLAEVGLSDCAAARPTTLSGGELARAGLAVALANDPPLLLADEPTGEVDADSEAELIDLLRGRAVSGGAVIVVTHSDRLAAAAHRVLRLADGKLADG